MDRLHHDAAWMMAAEILSRFSTRLSDEEYREMHEVVRHVLVAALEAIDVFTARPGRHAIPSVN